MNKELIASYAQRCGDYVYDYQGLYLHTELSDFFIDALGNTLSRSVIRQALTFSLSINSKTLCVSGRHWAITVKTEVKKYLEKILLEEETANSITIKQE